MLTRSSVACRTLLGYVLRDRNTGMFVGLGGEAPALERLVWWPSMESTLRAVGQLARRQAYMDSFRMELHRVWAEPGSVTRIAGTGEGDWEMATHVVLVGISVVDGKARFLAALTSLNDRPQWTDRVSRAATFPVSTRLDDPGTLLVRAAGRHCPPMRSLALVPVLVSAPRVVSEEVV